MGGGLCLPAFNAAQAMPGPGQGPGWLGRAIATPIWWPKAARHARRRSGDEVSDVTTFGSILSLVPSFKG